jgi:type IV pilus assembly protein PilA
MDYVRRAVREGHLSGATMACAQEGSGWEALEHLVKQYAPPSVAPPAPRASATEAAPDPASEKIRSGLPGWILALIVVVASLALIGTLAGLVGVPAYRDHVVRGQIEQGAKRAEKPRASVADFLRAHGRMPVDNAEAGLASAASMRGPYVESVRIEHGRVTVLFGPRAAARVRGRHLVFTPVPLAGAVTWTCASPDLPRGALPRSCR